MAYRLFLDTNALLNLQGAAFKEPFAISQKTLEEIENIKSSGTKDGETKYKARKVAHLLDENEELYLVIATNEDVMDVIDEFKLQVTPDNIILASAYLYDKNIEPVLVCTDDINCKFISKGIFKLKTKGTHDLNLIKNDDEYKGFKDVILSDEEMSYFYNNMNEYTDELILNEYLIIRKYDGEVVDTYKWNGEQLKKVCNKTIKSSFFGDKIKPKDIYQSCVIDSILNNTMTCISGHAGSGKSLLSLATIMYLIEQGKYDRVVIMFNPCKTKGSMDMGFYSGDAKEKALQNSIGQILSTKFGDMYAVELLLQQDKIRLVSMADVRGMEVRDNEILYITECQNTNSDLLSLCLSRVSSDSKIIIEGDYNTQVDSYLFDGESNGMKSAINVFTGEPEFGYVQLQKVYRSRIAELAEKLKNRGN